MKSFLLYKILNGYTAPNLKESLTGSSLTQMSQWRTVIKIKLNQGIINHLE
jgi:hypothetical protein